MTLGQYKIENEKFLRNKTIKRITLDRLRYLQENINLLASVGESIHVVVVERLYGDEVDYDKIDIKHTLLANNIVKTEIELKKMLKEMYDERINNV